MRALEPGWQRWLNASGCTFTRERYLSHAAESLPPLAGFGVEDWGAKPSPAAETATSPASGRGDTRVAVPLSRLERRCCYANRFSAMVPSGDVFTS